MLRVFRTALLVVAGCGRLGFEARVDPDAQSDGQREDAVRGAYAQLVLSDGPAAYWRFEETAGMVALDETGNYPGTFTGELTRGAGIAGGRGAVFDGSSTRLEVGDVFAFSGTAPYTLEVWAMPSVVNASVRFIVDRSSTARPVDGYQLYYAQSFTLHARSVGGAEGGYARGAGIAAERWTHIVATYDGMRDNLFIDGVLVDSTIAPVLPAPSAGAFTVGDVGSGNFNKYLGVLDEVAIYQTALPAVRVAAHAAAGR